MTIELKEDIAYILLGKISDRPQAINSKAGGREKELIPLNLNATDFVGRNTNHSEVLAHIDYLNQKGYINADFTGDAYADSGPNPFPETVELKAVAITPSGEALLQRMNEHLPASLQSGPSVALVTKDMDFLEKVMIKGHIGDIYDARDISELVFRTMRDLMTNEAVEDVATELHKEALHTDKKAAQGEIVDLWKDSNPLVRFLSKVRPTLKFDDETFLFRIGNEGGLPKTTGPKTVVKAVFSATKDELSPERITEIAEFMPGKIRQIWEQA